MGPPPRGAQCPFNVNIDAGMSLWSGCDAATDWSSLTCESVSQETLLYFLYLFLFSWILCEWDFHWSFSISLQRITDSCSYISKRLWYPSKLFLRNLIATVGLDSEWSCHLKDDLCRLDQVNIVPLRAFPKADMDVMPYGRCVLTLRSHDVCTRSLEVAGQSKLEVQLTFPLVKWPWRAGCFSRTLVSLSVRNTSYSYLNVKSLGQFRI